MNDCSSKKLTSSVILHMLYLVHMDYYKDKVAIVTGGGSGIGRALCEELGRMGAKVVVADINTQGAEKTAQTVTASGGWARSTRLDVTKAEDVQKLINDTAAEHGHLDFMFNNAGIAYIGEARDMDLDQWHRILDVNLNGEIYGSIAAYKLMVRQGFGHIVNTASVAGLFPTAGEVPYTTTKHGVVGLSLSLRLEGSGLGVKVSVVCPGFVRTELFDTAQIVKADRKDVLGMIPPRTIGNVKLLAKAVLRGVARNKAVIVFPFFYRIIWWIYRLSPSLLEPIGHKMAADFRKFRKDI